MDLSRLRPSQRRHRGRRPGLRRRRRPSHGLRAPHRQMSGCGLRPACCGISVGAPRGVATTAWVAHSGASGCRRAGCVRGGRSFPVVLVGGGFQDDSLPRFLRTRCLPSRRHDPALRPALGRRRRSWPRSPGATRVFGCRQDEGEVIAAATETGSSVADAIRDDGVRAAARRRPVALFDAQPSRVGPDRLAHRAHGHEGTGVPPVGREAVARLVGDPVRHRRG